MSKLDVKCHGDVINKYFELNKKLEKHGLMVKCWGRIAIAKISEPHNNYLANNLDTIAMDSSEVKVNY